MIIALLGYGLVEIPRIFWRRSFPETRLKYHYHRVGRAAERLTDSRCGGGGWGAAGWLAGSVVTLARRAAAGWLLCGGCILAGVPLWDGGSKQSSTRLPPSPAQR